MPALTHRRYPERQDCWHVYFGDVHVGTIARRVGQPHDQDPWQWLCGFYPGSDPGEQRGGTAATFDKARADFEVEWQRFLLRRTPATTKHGATSATGQPGNTPCGKVASGFHRSRPADEIHR